MKEIRSIELVLENCEVIEIKREDVGRFYIENIKRSISRNAMNSVSDHISCDELFLQISSKVNKTSSYTCTWSSNKTPPFERLNRHKDVTAVSINYQDGTEEYIYVKWSGDSEYVNEYQSNAINPHTGDFYIVISDKERVELYFKNQLEDKDAWYWDLYSESDDEEREEV